MTWFIVDVEADGPAPGLFSMVSLGAVKLDRKLETTFYGKFAPLLGASFDLEALTVCDTTREQHLTYPIASDTIIDFRDWLEAHTEPGTDPVFVSDNVAFDWQFPHYYFHKFLGRNPFGHSGHRIGDMYAGLNKTTKGSSKWRKFSKTKHTHHPVDDAKGHAEALLKMVDMGFEIEGF